MRWVRNDKGVRRDGARERFAAMRGQRASEDEVALGGPRRVARHAERHHPAVRKAKCRPDAAPRVSAT